MMIERYQFSEQKEVMDDKEHPDHDLIIEKILICRAATAENFGSINVYSAAENLYAALYVPENIDNLIKPNEKHPDRMDFLKRSLKIKPEKIPDKEDFIETVRHAMIKEVDFSQCFSEESKKQFYDVMERSETTVIWTDGDAFGVPEYQLPGSHEQILKIGSAKFFNQMRREIAQKRGIDHKEVLSILAREGKMRFIPELVEKFEERGIEEVIIIEDRIKNLNQAMLLIQKTAPAMKIFPIWIRQDESENNDKEIPGPVCGISSISELTSTLENKGIFSNGKKIGTIFDMDGVLSDDDIRRRIQTDAVITALQERNWI